MCFAAFFTYFQVYGETEDRPAIMCIVAWKADPIEKIAMNEPFEVQVKH